MGVGVTVVLLDADVCLADSTGTVVCNDHGEEEEDEERGETESYMVSTGSEKETFFFGVTVGVGSVFFMILGDEGVETVYVLPIEKEEERKCPFAVLGMMTSESRNRNRLLSMRPRAAAVA